MSKFKPPRSKPGTQKTVVKSPVLGCINKFKNLLNGGNSRWVIVG